MKILYDLVTVIRELLPESHWETGKAAKALIYESGDLPIAVREHGSEPRGIGCTIVRLFLFGYNPSFSDEGFFDVWEGKKAGKGGFCCKRSLKWDILPYWIC